MGGLTLPASGFVYLDANSIIYTVEKVQPFAALLTPVWEAASTGRIRVVSSELTLLETLVRPMKEGNQRLQKHLTEFLLNSREMRLASIDVPVLMHAARIRADAALKTPDAIHAATALASGCKMFLTNDKDFRRVTGLPVTVLSALV